jgi:hypothetical protein
MIYRVAYDLDHLAADQDQDASLIQFPGYRRGSFFNPSVYPAGTMPRPLEFVGHLDSLAATDYPYISPYTSSMMSRRMLDALLSVKPFAYHTHPTRIYSSALETQVRYAANRFRMEAVVNDPALYTDAFVMVQLLDKTNVIDFDQTLYALQDGETGWAVRASELGSPDLNNLLIERLVLTVAEEELPGAFVSDALTGLYCTTLGYRPAARH